MGRVSLCSSNCTTGLYIHRRELYFDDCQGALADYNRAIAINSNAPTAETYRSILGQQEYYQSDGNMIRNKKYNH